MGMEKIRAEKNTKIVNLCIYTVSNFCSFSIIEYQQKLKYFVKRNALN